VLCPADLLVFDIMFVQYSAVCDTSPELYAEYLALESKYLSHVLDPTSGVEGFASDVFGYGLVDVCARFVDRSKGVVGSGEECEYVRDMGSRRLDAGVVEVDSCGSRGGIRSTVVDAERVEKSEEGVGPVLSGSSDSVGGDACSRKAERREKNKRRKANRRARVRSGDVGLGVETGPVLGTGCVKGEHCGGIESSPVPVWRRGAVSVSTGSGDVGLKKGFFSDLSVEQRVELQKSRAALLVKQNQLAAERADRELEVLRATDIEVEKKRQATKLRAAIERNMVSIEKTHATLKATDNVGRDELDHDVHTVVTDSVPSLSSGSISPNSSASMAEFRAVQKQLLDKEAEIEKVYAVLKRIGIEPGVVEYLDKDRWTINSQGTLDDDAKVALEVLAPEGYVIPGQAYMSKGDRVTIRAL